MSQFRIEEVEPMGFRRIDALPVRRQRRIGINPNDASGVVVRDINHFTECMVATWPEYPDSMCTCHDDSPDWD